MGYELPVSGTLQPGTPLGQPHAAAAWHRQPRRYRRHLTAAFYAGKKVDVAYDDPTITTCETIANRTRVFR